MSPPGPVVWISPTPTSSPSPKIVAGPRSSGRLPSLRTRARRNAVAASAGVASWNAEAWNVCDASGMRTCLLELGMVALVGA